MGGGYHRESILNQQPGWENQNLAWWVNNIWNHLRMSSYWFSRAEWSSTPLSGAHHGDRMISCPRGHLAMCKNNWGCCIWGGGAPGTWSVETRDAAPHLTVSKMSHPREPFSSSAATERTRPGFDRFRNSASSLLLLKTHMGISVFRHLPCFSCVDWPSCRCWFWTHSKERKERLSWKLWWTICSISSMVGWILPSSSWVAIMSLSCSPTYGLPPRR